MKVAIVHDYLRDYGGAERVVEAIHSIFPEAPLYTAFVDKGQLGLHWKKFADWEIRESWLTKLPFYKKLFSPLRIWSPNYFKSFDLSGYDLVISSSNAYFSKAVTAPNGIHVCYCHTPARSLYGYTTMTDWKKNWLVRAGGTLINHYLRVVDFKIAQEVDYFIANSKVTQKRIKKFYRRESKVIYPPIEIPEKLAKLEPDREEYYLYVGRIAQSKHVDLAIQVCNELGLPLKVAGTGGGIGYLQKIAGPSVEILGEVSDPQLVGLYQGAKALFFPAEDEDFGMVPVEAMGYGVPVIAHRSGGPQESIIEGETGVFFDDFTTESLAKAVGKFNKTKWDREKIHRHAKNFSAAAFKKNLQNYLNSLLTT